jgi:subtilisin family serine protease
MQPTTMATIQAQEVFIQDVETLGGMVTGSLIYSDNAIIATIDVGTLTELASNPNVKSITKDKAVWFAPTATDDTNNYNYSLIDDRYEDMNVLPLWNANLTGKGIVVAVVDTGINSKLPCFQRDGKSIVIDSLQLYGEYVMWHGTAVASCIASQDSKIKGIAPGVELLNVEVFLESGSAKLSDIKKGWEWVAKWSATHPDKFVICCNSIGAPPVGLTGGWIAPGMLDSQANNMVLNCNIPMIVAAGNGYVSNPLSMKINCPGQAQYVLTVGAVDYNGFLAPFSCRGGTVDGKPKPDVVAPGVDILMFDANGREKTASGTSFSTPLTAGVAALVAEQHKDYSATQIQDAIKDGANPDVLPHGATYDKNLGHGEVNAANALAVISGLKPEETNTYSFAAFVIIGVIVFFVPEIRRKK